MLFTDCASKTGTNEKLNFTMVNSWFPLLLYQLLIIIQSTLSESIFSDNHDVQNCIQDDEQLFCLQLTDIQSTGSVYVTMTDEYSNSYKSGTLTSSTIDLATTCFLYDKLNEVTVKIYSISSNTIETIPVKMKDFTSSPTTYQPSNTNTQFNIWIAEGIYPSIYPSTYTSQT